MLGVTPIIVFRVDVETQYQVSLATPKICIWMVGAKDDKNKRVVRLTFLSDIKKTEEKRQNKVMEESSKSHL